MFFCKRSALLISLAFLVLPFISFAQKAEGDKELESRLNNVKNMEIGYDAAKELFKLCDLEMPAELLQHVLRATGAALIYAGKMDVYDSYVAPKLDSKNEFEDSLMNGCPQCHGEGKTAQKCPECKGSGRCSKSNCQGRGRVIIHEVDGGAHWDLCGFCNGTGKCNRCKGTGSLTKGRCARCGGKGRTVAKANVKLVYSAELDAATSFSRRERERLEREKREKLEAERRETERKEREEREARERARLEAFEREQIAKGLVKYNGEWMTPAEKAQAEKNDRFSKLILGNSRLNSQFKVFQIFEDGQALCCFREFDSFRGWYDSDVIFCLHFSASDNRTVTEGQIFNNNLYWSGTYTYTTVKGARSKVTLYSIDLAEAIKEARRQGFDER